jgi:hypothetical protein
MHQRRTLRDPRVNYDLKESRHKTLHGRASVIIAAEEEIF